MALYHWSSTARGVSIKGENSYPESTQSSSSGLDDGYGTTFDVNINPALRRLEQLLTCIRPTKLVLIPSLTPFLLGLQCSGEVDWSPAPISIPMQLLTM